MQIPYGKQSISSSDIKAVEKVLKSDFLTQGNVVPSFEYSVSKYTKAKHCIAVNSATSALHIACKALGVGKNDIVWTSPNTYVASANAALYCGAKIDFIDIDSETYNLSTSALHTKLKDSAKKNKLPKVLIVVHLAGMSCDMKEIFKLSKRYGFKIIEDASHAIGANYFKNKVGSCKFSNICVFSFHPVKIITTGEGGMALTNDPGLAKKMMILRTHGVAKTNKSFDQSNNNEIWNYHQFDLGFNYRMTDIQAALGLSQLKRIDAFVKKRNVIARKYTKAFLSLPIQLPLIDPSHLSSFHLYVIRINTERAGISRNTAYKKLQSQGIQVNIHYNPVYLQPYYASLGFKRNYCPKSEKYAQECLSLPIYPDLSVDEQNFVIKKIKELFKN